MLSRMGQSAQSGTLFLMPNTLDLGLPLASDEAVPALNDVLGHSALLQAAGLRYWVAENAKTTRFFLKRVHAIVPLKTPIQELHIQELPRSAKKGKQETKGSQYIELLSPLQAGHNMGLISEAGLPCVADPGAGLVQQAHELNIRVVPFAGPNSLMLALAASGLNGQSFSFYGYLPIQEQERQHKLKELEMLSKRLSQTQLVIETPYRNNTLVAALLAHLHESTWLSISCGLTLPTGFTRTARIAQWRQQHTALPSNMPCVFSFLA